MFQQQIRFTGSKKRLQMMELAKRFLGKNCIIYYFDSQARGVITQVDDDAILIQTKRGEELLNLNFITRIMEYPSKK